jgi:hypothetical protein
MRLLICRPHSSLLQEGRIDPNRDFPFVQSASHCMQTVAARALNEVWRSYLLPAAISFHGGLQVRGLTLVFLIEGTKDCTVPFDCFGRPHVNTLACFV